MITLKLNDGHALPAIGFGTYPMNNEEARVATGRAIDAGYRLIDTATRYGNEVGVGQAIRDSDVPRDQIVVTTKLPGADQGYQTTLDSFESARLRMGLDYIDLYLIHWPLPRVGRYVDSFKAMLKLRDDGVLRSVGVSNFTEEHLRRVIEETGATPAVNQVELHPLFNQHALRAVHEKLDIVTCAWSPLGRGDVLDDENIREIADSHDVTPAQVVLRWEIQLGVVPVPKSADRWRQAANLDVFSFALADDEVAVLSDMESGRQGGDPTTHEEF